MPLAFCIQRKHVALRLVCLQSRTCRNKLNISSRENDIFVQMILLVVNDKEMTKEADELFHPTENNRLNNDEETQTRAGVHHQEDIMEEEFDGDFWFKVMKTALYAFIRAALLKFYID